MNTIIISFIFGISIFSVALILIGSDEGRDKRLEQRLKDLKKSAGSSDNISKSMQLLAEDTVYQVKMAGRILEKLKFTDHIKKRLKIANVKVAVDVFVLMSWCFSIPFIIVAILKAKFAILFLPMGLGATFLPLLMLNIKIKKKYDMFAQQFPDALGMIASSLRAGHSMHAAFQVVVNEMPDPIASVFRVIVDDVSLGRDTREALNNMLEQIPDSMDLRFFVTAVLIQREIGGNLAEILDSLSTTIRERFKMLGQLKAQTAQAKLSGIIIAIAPFAIGTVLYFMNPEYMSPLFTKLIGQMALGGAVLLGVTGFCVMMQVTKIEV